MSLTAEQLTTINALTDLILSGDVDDSVDIIRDAVLQAAKVRQSAVASKLVQGLTPGDTVRLVRIRPKYMAGMRVRYEGAHSLDKATCTVLVSAGKFQAGQTIFVHISCMEKIS